MTKVWLLAFTMCVIDILPATASDHFITRLKLPSGQTIVVSEGELEARSIGSFSVRLYLAAPLKDETTFFISGLISARDGVVEKVLLEDINNDQQAEIIVIVRSSGTGSYLSAHAFAIHKEALVLIALVEGLQATANPISALKKSQSRRKPDV